MFLRGERKYGLLVLRGVFDREYRAIPGHEASDVEWRASVRRPRRL